MIEGFKLSDREYVGAMDGDMSHDPSILNQMITSLISYDIVIGSRFEKGSVVEKWGLHRRIISGMGVFMARILTRTKDPLSGYFFMKRSAVNGLKLKTKGYKIVLRF